MGLNFKWSNFLSVYIKYIKYKKYKKYRKYRKKARQADIIILI